MPGAMGKGWKKDTNQKGALNTHAWTATRLGDINVAGAEQDGHVVGISTRKLALGLGLGRLQQGWERRFAVGGLQRSTMTASNAHRS